MCAMDEMQAMPVKRARRMSLLRNGRRGDRDDADDVLLFLPLPLLPTMEPPPNALPMLLIVGAAVLVGRSIG